MSEVGARRAPELRADVVIVGSGAGGGTVAQRLLPMAAAGRRVLVLEQGPRLHPSEFTGDELEMAPALYADDGGYLTAQGTMTLAFGRAYGGSTVVYTGTSLPPPERVIRAWDVPDLEHADLVRRARRYVEENNVHFFRDEEINENNRLFVEGCRALELECHQFPVNVRGCRGSSLCNLGCPNGAKQGTHAVQLPRAEAGGVEVVTRARVMRVEEGAVYVRVEPRPAGALGAEPEWPPGEYCVEADTVVLCGGSMGTVPLLLRSGFGRRLPRLGHGFTCHPAFILVAEHERDITNDVGHPKSFYVDHGASEGYVLETCMYFPFVTAKNLTGFGAEHEAFMRAFSRLQMILVLACDKAVEENRITVDRDGNPVVHYTFTPSVRRSMVRATRTAARIFFAAGARRVHAPPADPPLVERREMDRIDERIRERCFLPGRLSISAAHLMGGCGMGSTVEDSVTDALGRVHGHPWLRVADASLFPDSIEINPYLTIMALADRVAEGILTDMDMRV
ncbi:MAG: GMC family oxidoreductase N-terminal domain-containing protein [Gemmatimonadota bacterium]